MNKQAEEGGGGKVALRRTPLSSGPAEGQETLRIGGCQGRLVVGGMGTREDREGLGVPGDGGSGVANS